MNKGLKIKGVVALVLALTGCSSTPYKNDCGYIVETGEDATMSQSLGKRIVLKHDNQRWVLESRDVIDSWKKAYQLKEGSLHFEYSKENKDYRMKGNLYDIFTNGDIEGYMKVLEEADVSPRNRKVSEQEALDLFAAEAKKSITIWNSQNKRD